MHTEAPTGYQSALSPPVLLLSRSAFVDPEPLDDDDDDDDDKGSLRRRGHIRRRHRRTQSECQLTTESAMEMTASPDESDDDDDDALTPLIEKLTKLYTEIPRGDTIRSPDTRDTLDTPNTLDTPDSPSVYSLYPDDQMTPRAEVPPVPSPFADQGEGVIALHDWDNGIHYREAKRFGVPEGRLLPKRVATVYLRNLLRARRIAAGLPVDMTPDSLNDV